MFDLKGAYQKEKNRVTGKIKNNFSSSTLKARYTPNSIKNKADTSTMKFSIPTVDKSRNVLKTLGKQMFENSGIKQSAAAKKEKMQRDKDMKTAKEKGYPIAPNGLPYESNDIKYLTEHGYTLEAAFTELSKQQKYTRTIVYAPNGIPYTDNDIKYLTDHGYTRDQALDYLSKCPKYKKVTPGDIKAQNKKVIHDAAKDFVEGQTEALLATDVAGIAAHYGIKTRWDEETKEKIRAIIRGDQNVVFANDKIIKNAVLATEKEITRFFDKRVAVKTAETFDQGDKLLSDGMQYIKRFDTQRMLLTEEDISKALVGDVEKTLKTRVKGINKVGNKLANLDNKMGKFGMSLGLGEQYNGMLKNVSQTISDDLARRLKPKLTKQYKITENISKRLKYYQDNLKIMKQKALARVEEWKEEAKKKIAKEEQKLIKNALGSLTKNLNKIKFKF